MFDRLAVFVPDRLSELVAKGEVTDRYYNPGGVFREVHLILTNDDQPELEQVQCMVGDAMLYVHNLDPGPKFFHRTLGWQPVLMSSYTDRAIRLLKEISPNLIRTHNNFLEGYLAFKAKEAFGIPYVVSLHGVWDKDPADVRPLHNKVIMKFRRKLEKSCLQNADYIIAVYQPVVEYAKRLNSKNVDLVYNAVSANVQRKVDYKISGRPKIITINRQVNQKNPENIIGAVADLDCEYTIVGDGVLNSYLRNLVKELGCQEKVKFINSMPNSDVVRALADYDVLVAHCDYLGISKSTIEAALAGLPVVLNRQPDGVTPDLEGGWVCLADNSKNGYVGALAKLFEDEVLRSRQGLAGRSYAEQHFLPSQMEEKVASIYRNVVMKAQAC